VPDLGGPSYHVHGEEAGAALERSPAKFDGGTNLLNGASRSFWGDL
jgi:hypothetical protein